jgi:hypothetical protein
MMNWETNTPRFRIALSVCLIWVLVIGYLGNKHYDFISESLEQEYFNTKTDCTAYKETLGDGGLLKLKPATEYEIERCMSAEVESHRMYESMYANEKKVQALVDSSKLAIIPPIILLLIIALWSTIGRTIQRTIKKYIDWIKGTTPPQ